MLVWKWQSGSIYDLSWRHNSVAIKPVDETYDMYYFQYSKYVISKDFNQNLNELVLYVWLEFDIKKL